MQFYCILGRIQNVFDFCVNFIGFLFVMSFEGLVDEGADTVVEGAVLLAFAVFSIHFCMLNC